MLSTNAAYPSSYAGHVDEVMLVIMGISLVLLVGVTAAMVYFVYKYHHSRHPEPKQTYGNTLIEIVWIVIPTIIVIAMFWYGYVEYGALRKTKDADIENQVSIRGSMWKWTFEYENGAVIDSFLYVPNNKTTKLNITSADVLHSFYMPAFRLKEDAIMGQNTFIILNPELEFEKGETQREFQVQCAEYCGLWHSNMNARLVVMEENAYKAWFEKNNMKKEEVKTDSASVAIAPVDTTKNDVVAVADSTKEKPKTKKKKKSKKNDAEA